MVNKSNISVLNKEECCGCRSCGNICPKQCISFRKDSEGFIYPVVDESICISCGKCKSICPEINPVFNKKADMVEAAFAKDNYERQSGSSGGIFGLLAGSIIKNGGKVWGAAFDENLRLYHISAVTTEELNRLYKSKYLQSNTQDIYSIIKSDIKNGVITLFSGTPCQCNAVRNYIGESEFLITIEVVCHGVPSQDLFDKCIEWEEKKNKCKIKNFQFRSKYKNALHPQAFSYLCQVNSRQKIVNGLHYQFPFYFGFQKYITLRPSCYECKWARPERCADITLGDFWGIENYSPGQNAKDGISQVIINTPKGDKLFKELVSKDLIWDETFPIEVALKNNGCLNSPTKLKPERAAFFYALNSQPFEDVANTYLKSKRQWIFDIYYGLPGFIRHLVRKIMDKRMKYE